MEGGVRRIRFLLSPQNPIDAEILTWLDSLPHTARGTEMKPHLTAALIEYIRKSQGYVQRTAVPTNASPSSADSRHESARAEQRLLTPSDSTPAVPSGALARHLLKDFG